MMSKNYFILFIGIFLSCIIGLMLYKHFFTIVNREIIVLAPEMSATKKKPDDSGGLIIAHSENSLYEKLRLRSTSTEKINILPEPEEPMQLNDKLALDTPVLILDSIDEILANISIDEDVDLIQPENANIVENIESEDAKEQIIVQKEEGTQIYVEGTKLNIVRSTNPRFGTNKIDVIKNEYGGYKIQLSLVFSQNDAYSRWQEISKRHSKILKGANLIVKKINGQNDRIFYMIMAGTYPSLNQAKLVCKKLILHKQNCIVIK